MRQYLTIKYATQVTIKQETRNNKKAESRVTEETIADILYSLVKRFSLPGLNFGLSFGICVTRNKKADCRVTEEKISGILYSLVKRFSLPGIFHGLSYGISVSFALSLMFSFFLKKRKRPK